MENEMFTKINFNIATPSHICQMDSEERAKREAEKLAKREAEKLAKREAEKLAKREAEELAKAEAEELFGAILAKNNFDTFHLEVVVALPKAAHHYYPYGNGDKLTIVKGRMALTMEKCHTGWEASYWAKVFYLAA